MCGCNGWFSFERPGLSATWWERPEKWRSGRTPCVENARKKRNEKNWSALNGHDWPQHGEGIRKNMENGPRPGVPGTRTVMKKGRENIEPDERMWFVGAKSYKKAKCPVGHFDLLLRFEGRTLAHCVAQFYAFVETVAPFAAVWLQILHGCVYNLTSATIHSKKKSALKGIFAEPADMGFELWFKKKALIIGLLLESELASGSRLASCIGRCRQFQKNDCLLPLISARMSAFLHSGEQTTFFHFEFDYAVKMFHLCMRMGTRRHFDQLVSDKRRMTLLLACILILFHWFGIAIWSWLDRWRPNIFLRFLRKWWFFVNFEILRTCSFMRAM